MKNFVRKYQAEIISILAIVQVIVTITGIIYGNYLQSKIQTNGVNLSGGSEIYDNGIGVQQNNQQ